MVCQLLDGLAVELDLAPVTALPPLGLFANQAPDTGPVGQAEVKTGAEMSDLGWDLDGMAYQHQGARRGFMPLGDLFDQARVQGIGQIGKCVATS